MNIGLRIDVDTYRGTRLGVPALCRRLAAADIRATFFFSLGPDHMGRNLWRLLRPAFLRKMLRSRAAGLYGWSILLCGTLGPGPQIGKRLSAVIRAAAADGHEIGLHAWDHYAWQTHLERMDASAIRADLERGVHALTDLLGRPPTCSAAPAWKCTDTVLLEKERLHFAYNSDCRGTSVFRPLVAGRALPQPQVPVTLPTYDEAVGRDGVTDATYNDWLLAQLRPDRLNVLTIHAEVEGIARAALFRDFLEKARAQGHRFIPLGECLPPAEALPIGRLAKGTIAGREGWAALQEPPAGM